VLEGEGKRVRVILGSVWGAEAPVPLAHETFYADAELAPHAALPLPDNQEDRGVYVVQGAVTQGGQTYEVGDPTIQSMVVREPIGVCGQVIPWNYPLLMAAWKLAPGLAAGNCCILKPAETTPLTAIELFKLIAEAGFPPGVVNVLPGRGEITGHAIAEHPGVRFISFTGSPGVGQAILRTCDRHGTRMKREMGGNGAAIVMGDADPELVARMVGRYTNQHFGQTCRTAWLPDTFGFTGAMQVMQLALAENIQQRLFARSAFESSALIAWPGRVATMCALSGIPSRTMSPMISRILWRTNSSSNRSAFSTPVSPMTMAFSSEPPSARPFWRNHSTSFRKPKVRAAAMLSAKLASVIRSVRDWSRSSGWSKLMV
jgi:hypothetical protein